MNHSNPDQLSGSDTIETAAAAWLCEREEGFTPGRAQEFAAWRAADPRHEAVVVRTECAMSLLAELPALRAPLAERIALESRPVVRRTFFSAQAWLGIAAAFVLAAGLYWLWPFQSGQAQHYATSADRQKQIALNDGSVMNLSVSSEASVRLMANERRVKVTGGEAFFEVAHDTARPFIVTAAGIRVRAVGTAFSVRVGDAGVAVLVSEGKVEVTREPAAPSRAASIASELSMLVAGDRATFVHGNPSAFPRIERVSTDALQEATRWHARVMTFSDLPLREAIVLFNRRNETQLVLADAELGNVKIGGTFAADQVDAFVRLLERDGDLVAERRGSREIALRRAP